MSQHNFTCPAGLDLSAVAPGNRALLTDTDVIQARAGKTRTLAELNAHGRILRARTLLIHACHTLAAAKDLVDAATSELHAAEAEELEAMRAALEGGAK